MSNAEKAVEGIKQEKGTPEQWLKMIEKGGGLKAGEDKWMGLSDWLKEHKGKSITKQEVLDFIRENQIQIEEVKYEQFGEGLIDEATGKLGAELKEIGWEAMCEKYPGFEELFETYNGELVWSEERASVGEYEDFIIDNKIVNVNPDSNAINETRERYTTKGLKGKREIALTVPSIEPYNSHDKIHFGDAGEGRAVAWVRFGDTEIPRKDPAAQKAFDDAQNAWDDFGNEMYCATRKTLNDHIKYKGNCPKLQDVFFTTKQRFFCSFC